MTFCPQCGEQKIQNIKNRKWLCASCGYELYNNVASAVGLLIFDKDGRVLFERRAKEPRRGFLAFPGGFVDPDESAEEAAARECFEEIGAKVVSLKYVASFPNTYEYKGVLYKTCDIFFAAKILENNDFLTQKGEVLSLEWKSVKTKAELDSLDLAFESARKTLSVWLESKE